MQKKTQNAFEQNEAFLKIRTCRYHLWWFSLHLKWFVTVWSSSLASLSKLRVFTQQPVVTRATKTEAIYRTSSAYPIAYSTSNTTVLQRLQQFQPLVFYQGDYRQLQVKCTELWRPKLNSYSTDFSIAIHLSRQSLLCLQGSSRAELVACIIL